MQKHGGIPQQHPKDDYEQDSAGSQYRGPEWRHLQYELIPVLHWTKLKWRAVFKSVYEGFCFADLYVLSKCVEDLFGYFHCFGEVLLPVCINYILPWVVPVEVTDWLLKCGMHNIYCSWTWKNASKSAIQFYDYVKISLDTLQYDDKLTSVPTEAKLGFAVVWKSNRDYTNIYGKQNHIQRSAVNMHLPVL